MDKLEERHIGAGTEEYEVFLRLYESAFPPEERIEPDLLVEGAKFPACSFVAYYDDGVFCGFTYEINVECALYLLFLAVNNEVRSRGYGSRILAQVKEHAKDRPVVLDIEPIDDGAPNAEQRVKRLQFYERNGYKPNGYQIIEDGVTYTALSTDGFADMEAFAEELAGLAPGFARFEIVRM